MRRRILLIGVVAAAALGTFVGFLPELRAVKATGTTAFTDGSRYIFVPSRTRPEVTVVDGIAGAVAGTLRLGHVPAQIVVSDAAGRLVASDIGNNALSIVDLETGQLDRTLELGMTPDRIVLSPDGYLVAASDATSGSVVVVSLFNYRELARIEGFSGRTGLSFNLGGSQLYVRDGAANHLAIVDLVQNKIIDQIGLAKTLPSSRTAHELDDSALTRSPDGRYGFVSSTSEGTVAVIDLGTGKLIKAIPVGKAPRRPYGTADGRLMLVPNEGDGTISVVDTALLQVVATLAGARDVLAINTGWFESVALVMSAGEDKIVLLDLMTFRNVGEIPLPGTPGPGVVTPDGKKLFVALDTGKLATIDIRARKVDTVIAGLVSSPYGATMARTNNYCH